MCGQPLDIDQPLTLSSVDASLAVNVCWLRIISNRPLSSFLPATINAVDCSRCGIKITGWQSRLPVEGKPKPKSTKTNVIAPVRLFSSQESWATWLEKNHCKSDGLWLRLAKKGSELRSVSYGEALEIAICYGWIDGQKRPESEQAWLQRFLPRSEKSIWSKINREKALGLIAQGRMKKAGREAIESAKKNGRWESAYDSPKAAEVPEDLQAALDASPRAREFFLSLDKTNRYAVLFRIQTVKRAETRAAKIRQFVEMLERNERIHEPRSPRKSSK
jgi:uncharacterized protein YdeI (YjbR/CyaY-like superfamily)